MLLLLLPSSVTLTVAFSLFSLTKRRRLFFSSFHFGPHAHAIHPSIPFSFYL
jgi:hypothetical protein